MHLALTHPKRVAQLAVVDMSPVAYTHDFDAVLSGFHAVELDAIRSRADADAQMRAAVPASAVRAFLLQNLTQQEGRWVWRLNLPALAQQPRQLSWDDLIPAHLLTEDPFEKLSPDQKYMVRWLL